MNGDPDNDEYESELFPDQQLLSIIRSLARDYQHLSRMFNKNPQHSQAYREAMEVLK